jgi:two-component system response regulator AlgR
MDAMTDVRVLVVDDQDAYRRAMAAVVSETAGFEVVGSVSTGEASLEVARELAPDLVLMDVNLPGIDGVEAASRLAEGGAASTPVVVLLSTYDEDEFDRAGCGAAAYVSKASFSSERLQQVWQEATSEPQRPAAGS